MAGLNSMGCELLTTGEMGRADAMTISGGTPGSELMERAGAGVAAAALARFPEISYWNVLCGPGNNGGDGFVAARHLVGAGKTVALACLVPVERLAGDAAWAASTWDGPVQTFQDFAAEAGGLIDAVFGACDLHALADRGFRARSGGRLAEQLVDEFSDHQSKSLKMRQWRSRASASSAGVGLVATGWWARSSRGRSLIESL